MGRVNQILILFAHPALENSRINRHLIRAVRDLESVTIHDLYEAYPHFHINVRQEQALLESHDIIIFQHPFYWYSSPALLKEWQDLVLEHGFAYGHQGTALHGKKFLSAITTGGGAHAYSPEGHNRFSLREFLLPFEQTAYLCGMEYLPPFVIYGTHHIHQSQEIAQQAQNYRQAIAALRDDRIHWNELHQCEYFNQNLGRVIHTQEVTPHA